MTSTGQLFEADVLVVGAPRKKRREHRTAEEEFAYQIRANGLPEPAREWRFAKSIGRQWRFDFAFLDYKLAVEIEGFVFAMATVGGKRRMVSMGRHSHPDGAREDMRKYATAAWMGWTVIRFDPDMVKKREAIEHTMRCLIARGWKNPGMES